MKKILKKSSAILLIIVLVFSGSVFANANFSAGDVEFKNGMIYISGKTPSPHLSVMISVTKKTESKNNIDNIYYIEEILSDENSSYEFSFNMKNDPEGLSLTGEYKLYVKCEGKSIITKDFTYYDYTAVLNQLKSAQNGNAIYTALENLSERNSFIALGFDMDLYDLLLDDQKKAFADKLFASDLSQSDAKDVSEKFTSCLGVALINTKVNANVIKGLELLNPVCDKESYKSITDDTYKAFITECITLADNLEASSDVEASYKKAVALYKINISSVGAIDELLKNSSDTLGITNSDEFKKWTSLGGGDVTTASRNLVTYLSKNKAYTHQTLLDAIDKAATIISNSGGSSGGGGGGGSSKSSGSGYTLGGVTTIVPDAEKFTDLSLALWAKDAILNLSDKNIISGYGDNTFGPNNLIKREEFVKIIVSAFEVLDDGQDVSFADVGKNEWYYPYIKSAYNAGIVKGINDDSFGISSYVTRQDMAVMLYRIIKLNNIELEQKRNYQTFKDQDKISDYALESVKNLYMASFINGYEDLTFKPSGNATRAEAAYMIESILSAK